MPRLAGGSMITLGKPSSIDEAKVDATIKDIKGSYEGASGFAKHTLNNGWAITYRRRPPVEAPDTTEGG